MFQDEEPTNHAMERDESLIDNRSAGDPNGTMLEQGEKPLTAIAHHQLCPLAALHDLEIVPSPPDTQNTDQIPSLSMPRIAETPNTR